MDVRTELGFDHLTTFAGVDYSAARAQPNATWLAQGRLRPGAGTKNKELVIYNLAKTGSEQLADALIALLVKEKLIAGLDFPFSWPAPFLTWLAGRQEISDAGDCSSMIDWPFTRIEDLALEFGREPRRLTDELIRPKGQSPLHRINPGMLKMTWQGTKLLNRLQKAGCAVAPFDAPGPLPDNDAAKGPHGLVMEVYPAAILRSLALPYKKYKGSQPEAKALRAEILASLPKVTETIKTLPGLVLEPHLATLMLASDDALDAVLACYSACLAALLPELSAHQAIIASNMPDGQDQLEGWIYSPYSLLAEI